VLTRGDLAWFGARVLYPQTALLGQAPGILGVQPAAMLSATDESPTIRRAAAQSD